MKRLFSMSAALVCLSLLPTIDATAKTKTVGAWSVSEEEDDFSDGKKYVAMKIAGDGIVGIRCLLKKPSIAIATSTNYKEGDMFIAKIRVDKGEIADGVAAALTDKLLEVNAVDDSFYKTMSGGKKLSIRVSGGSGQIDYSFPISGIDKVLPGMLDSCGIK